MPLTIDPKTLQAGAEDVAVLLCAIGVPQGTCDALRVILPDFVLWIDSELEGGRDPRDKLMKLTLDAADKTANAIEEARNLK